MPSPTELTRPNPVVTQLDEAAEFNRRAKACPPQHAHNLYQQKDRLLREAIAQAPEQFLIDSILTRDPLIVGVSHRSSTRQFHLRVDRLPQVLWEKLVQESNALQPARDAEGATIPRRCMPRNRRM